MKLNKHLIVFVATFFGLNAILFTALHKYFLLLLHHTFYYCRKMANIFSVSLPENAGVVAFILLLLMLLVITIKFVFTISKVYRFRKDLNNNVVKNYMLVRLLDKTGLRSKVFIVNSYKPFAICFGIRQPKIYLSTKLIEILSAAELETVLRHEKYHLENRDTLTLMLATIFESFLPYFPIISDFIRNYRIERELLADQAAVSKSRGNKHLAAVLTKLLMCEPQYVFAGAPAIADSNTLEVRIRKLVSKRFVYRKFYWKNAVTSFASLGFLLALVFTPVSTFELHDKGRDVVVLCAHGRECKSCYY